MRTTTSVFMAKKKNANIFRIKKVNRKNSLIMSVSRSQSKQFMFIFKEI